MMDTRDGPALWPLAVLTGVVLLLCVADAARAEHTVTLTYPPHVGSLTILVCGNEVPTFRRKGAALEVWCPGQALPILTFPDCPVPRVTKPAIASTSFTITCRKTP